MYHKSDFREEFGWSNRGACSAELWKPFLESIRTFWIPMDSVRAQSQAFSAKASEGMG